MAMNTPHLREVELQLPSILTLEGHQSRGSIRVFAPGKPPKLRFEPGNYVQYKDGLYEIICAFRTANDPHEWLFWCEPRESLEPAEPASPIGALAEALGAGQSTPMVVKEIFRDSYQALTFFADIPASGDWVALTNKGLIQSGRLVSSGAVLASHRSKHPA